MHKYLFIQNSRSSPINLNSILQHLLSGQMDGQGCPPSYSQPYQQQRQSNTNDPLQSCRDASSRYPQQQPPDNPHISNAQFDPLQPPHHNQHHMQDEVHLRIQQHRVARPSHNQNEDRIWDQTPVTDHFSYPPPQRKDMSYQESSSHPTPELKDRSLKTRIRKLFNFPCSIYGKSLMLSIGFEALLVIIMQTVIVVLYFRSLRDTPLFPASGNPLDALPPYLDPRNQSRSIPAYMIVFVFAQLFQLALAWDAVSCQLFPPPATWFWFFFIYFLAHSVCCHFACVEI